jgi:putative two-component system response regulator
MRIVIADDMAVIRKMLHDKVTALGYTAVLAADGKAALEEIRAFPPDLILSDMVMPEMGGFELLRAVKSDKELRHIPMLMISSVDDNGSIVRCIESGAEDYLGKNDFNETLLKARIESCLAKKKLFDQEKTYRRQIENYNAALEKRVEEGVRRAIEAEKAIVFALSKLAESRDPEMGQHLERIKEYCRLLSEQMRSSRLNGKEIDDSFIANIAEAGTLHDIGKVAVPDKILLKPGKLTPGEFEIMKTHTVEGSRALSNLVDKFPDNAVLVMGAQIAECHHEKWDGTGYPHGLAAERIPLVARIVALADVYDALTSRRCYKKAMDHQGGSRIILEGRGTHFDPDVVDAFLRREGEFQSARQIFQG